LERAIRELEAKLPELRHLVVKEESQLTLSEEVAATAARLLRIVTQADEVASRLRHQLLGGDGGDVVVPDAPTPRRRSLRPTATWSGY
jgi:hypothetical protein